MARTPSRQVPERVVAAAGRVLQRQGPTGLRVRAVAAEAEVSPQSISNRFGSIDAVIDDLATAGHRRLQGRLLDLGLQPLPAVDDPLWLVIELLRRYRRFVHTEPHLDRLLFDPPPGLFTPSARTISAAAETRHLLEVAVAKAVAAGRLLPGPADELAWRLWVLTSGAARAEVGFPSRETRWFDGALATMVRGLRPRAHLDR